MLEMGTEIRINVRTTPEIKRDIEIAARLRGLTVSSLVNSLAVKAIREEKEREPKAFETKITLGNNSKAKVGTVKQAKKIVPLDEDMGLQFSGGRLKTSREKEVELNKLMDDAIDEVKKNKK